jgi:hypothetical protein
MSKKLRLKLEELSVESFRTDSGALAGRGTVRGRDDSVGATLPPTESSCDPYECPCIRTAQTCDLEICYGQSRGGGIC